ncbi:MAG: hypothetical protein AcusKO_07280 [Acuticoccus sp.]
MLMAAAGGRAWTGRRALREASAATLAVLSRSGSEALGLGGCQDLIALHADLSSVRLVIGARWAEVFGATAAQAAGRWWRSTLPARRTPPRVSRRLAVLVASGGTLACRHSDRGLPGSHLGPGRPAEQAVRPLLGARQSSGFSIPARAAVFAPTYQAACAQARATSAPPRAVSKQAFHIFPKIRELDALLTPDNQHRVFEVHAELAFWRLNGETPMPTAKRVKGVPQREGLADRIALLGRYGLPADFFAAERPGGLPLVDVVDAAALALIARRCASGIAAPFPDPPAHDGRGLRIAIWA